MVVFVDTGHWIALLDPADALHGKATVVARSLQKVRRVTTEAVLAEVLNLFSSRGVPFRKAAARLVRAILNDPNTDVVAMDSDKFHDGLDLYWAATRQGIQPF